MMRSIMKDSLTERYPSASFHPAFATFGNDDNTYTRNSLPERIDYLMFRSKSYLDMKVKETKYVVVQLSSSSNHILKWFRMIWCNLVPLAWPSQQHMSAGPNCRGVSGPGLQYAPVYDSQQWRTTCFALWSRSFARNLFCSRKTFLQRVSTKASFREPLVIELCHYKIYTYIDTF